MFAIPKSFSKAEKRKKKPFGKRALGRDTIKIQDFSVFRERQSKVRFHNLTRQPGRAKVLLSRSSRQSGELYLLPLATLSKTELNTELASGVTAVLCDRGPRLCLVRGKLDRKRKGRGNRK